MGNYNHRNFVSFGGGTIKKKKNRGKIKDSIVMIIGGVVIFVITFILYGFVDNPENDPKGKIKTDNKDILAQVELLEEMREIKEEKFKNLKDDVFLGENMAVDEYTENLIKNLKKSVSENNTDNNEDSDMRSLEKSEEKSDSNNNLEKLFSYLEDNSVRNESIFSKHDKVKVRPSVRIKRDKRRRKVNSLFAFSNTQKSARIYNNGFGDVIFNNNKVRKRFANSVTGTHESKEKIKLIYNSNPVFTIFQGDFLDAVLTNRIVNDKESSPVSAIVTKDLLSKNGKYVLIPSNSKVTGIAKKVSGQQDRRLFIFFERLILPNGRSVYFKDKERQLSALDITGALGIKGRKNSHFFSKFGSSLLFGSLNGLSGFAQNRIRQASGLSYFVDRSSENFNNLNDRLASDSLSILPTITVASGTKIKVHFSVDLDISAYSDISERSYY